MQKNVDRLDNPDPVTEGMVSCNLIDCHVSIAKVGLLTVVMFVTKAGSTVFATLVVQPCPMIAHQTPNLVTTSKL